MTNLTTLTILTILTLSNKLKMSHRIKLGCLFTWCVIMTPLLVASSEPQLSIGVMDETTLFTRGDASVACYRIPIMLRSSRGTLIVATEGRKNSCGDEGPKFIAIRRSLDGGATWLPAQFIWNDPSALGANLGVIFEDEANHTIFIQFVHGFKSWDPLKKPNMLGLLTSRDEGRTWSSPRNISEQLGSFAFVGGPGYGLSKKYSPNKGRMLFCGHSSLSTDGVYCIYSDDHGETWRWGAEMPSIPYGDWKRHGDFNPDECQPYEMPNGDIVVNARNQNEYRCACRIELVSKDGGETFSLRDIRVVEDLPDNQIQSSVLYQDGIVFFTNPYNRTVQNRINMTLSWSTDDGVSFQYQLPIWGKGSGYSALASIKPMDDMGFGVLGLAFEKGPDKRTYWHSIAFTRLAYIRR